MLDDRRARDQPRTLRCAAHGGVRLRRGVDARYAGRLSLPAPGAADGRAPWCGTGCRSRRRSDSSSHAGGGRDHRSEHQPPAAVRRAQLRRLRSVRHRHAAERVLRRRATVSWPLRLRRSRGTRWQLGGRAFAIASSYNDRAFRGGRELYEENLRQRPAHASAWLLRPLGPRARRCAPATPSTTRGSAGPETADEFTVPADQVVHALQFALEGQRGGWAGSIWWHPARRPAGVPWGPTGGVRRRARPTSSAVRRRPSAAIDGRSHRRSSRGSKRSGWTGTDLDRFSRYAFGTFDNRLRGYPVGAGALRSRRGGARRAGVVRVARSCASTDSSIPPRSAIRGYGSGLRNYTGHRRRGRGAGTIWDARRGRMGVWFSWCQRGWRARHARDPRQRLQGVLTVAEGPLDDSCNPAAGTCDRRARRRVWQQQQPVFRAGVDLVHFSVVVTDKNGVPITGLKSGGLRDRRGREAAEDHAVRRRRPRERAPLCTSGS